MVVLVVEQQWHTCGTAYQGQQNHQEFEWLPNFFLDSSPSPEVRLVGSWNCILLYIIKRVQLMPIIRVVTKSIDRVAGGWSVNHEYDFGINGTT